jgi:hypothetical protein
MAVRILLPSHCLISVTILFGQLTNWLGLNVWRGIVARLVRDLYLLSWIIPRFGRNSGLARHRENEDNSLAFCSNSQNCIPCGHQLQKGHIPVSLACIYCNQHETVEHALLFCPFAAKVWQEVKSDHVIHLRRRVFT